MLSFKAFNCIRGPCQQQRNLVDYSPVKFVYDLSLILSLLTKYVLIPSIHYMCCLFLNLVDIHQLNTYSAILLLTFPRHGCSSGVFRVCSPLLFFLPSSTHSLVYAEVNCDLQSSHRLSPRFQPDRVSPCCHPWTLTFSTASCLFLGNGLRGNIKPTQIY